MFFLAILFYCIVSGRPTVSFYMHLQCGLKVENSTWNYEKYSTVGGFQQPEWYKRKGHCTKRTKNAIGEKPHGKISHSFSKTYRETQNKNVHSDTIYP